MTLHRIIHFSFFIKLNFKLTRFNNDNMLIKEYTYDENGHLIKFIDVRISPDDTVKYGYNSKDQVVIESDKYKKQVDFPLDIFPSRQHYSLQIF